MRIKLNIEVSAKRIRRLANTANATVVLYLVLLQLQIIPPHV